jgi:DNA-binding NarL/FixJ family response regulator
VQARCWYERILNRWKTCEDTFTILPILLDGVVFYTDIGDLMKARQWLAELRGVMRVTDNPVGAAVLLEAEGAVQAREGDLLQAIGALRQAAEAWSSLKRDYQQALASQRLAEVLLANTRTETIGRAARQAAREEADRRLNEALAIYERLQIPAGIQAVHRLRSSTQLEAQHKRQRTLASRRTMQGLTQREAQVLRQLVAGRTNREIATDLSLSIGTVELHVSHILAKLNCETRTQAATYAIAQGWVNKLST